MRTFSEDLIDNLTDDELLQGQAELARAMMARGMAKAETERLERGLEPNNWGKLPLNVKTLASMGRDSKGAPLPPREKKGK